MRIAAIAALVVLLLFPVLGRTALAQEGAPAPEEPRSALEREIARLEELVVTPIRRAAPRFDLPYSTEVVRERELSGPLSPRSLPDAIAEVPGVMMQRTGYGQGSPFIRGLTGFRNLHLIDGIRLNQSVFRSGPNQYFATVDNLSLTRMEVVRGPASVLYGSDSIGGTVNLLPRTPERVDGVYGWGGRLYQRFAAAERSSTSRLEVRGGTGPDLGFLLGFDRKLFGDLRAGDGRLDETGYDEWDADARLLWHPAESLVLTLGYQRVSQDDVPRSHKTVFGRPWHGTSRGSERRRTLDQIRDLLYLRADLARPFSFTDEVSLTLSWHRQRETRFRVKGDGRSDRQGFTVDTLGLLARAVSETDLAVFTYGFDAYRDSVDSFKKKFDARGRQTSEAIQGPVADDATYDLLGFYLQGEAPVAADAVVTAGIRATWARADADAVQDPRSGKKTSIAESFSAVVGSVRAAWTGIEGLNLYGGVSQGFRAPNLSDLTRFDTARSNEIETPSPDLDPERVLAFEVGAKVDLSPARAEVSLFHTELRDLVQRFPTGRIIDGDQEVTKSNVGDGFVQGIEVGGEIDLGGGLTAVAGGSFVAGKADTFASSRRRKSSEHLDRLPPLSGRVGLDYRHPSGLFVRTRLRMADKADRLSPRDERDTQRIPPGGTPGYAVLDIVATYPVLPSATVTLGVENVFGKDYRVHGSGQNEPGRNLFLTLEVRF